MIIAHLTSVHFRYDPRVFLKECAGLARAGHSVFLVVADGKGDETRNGVRIVDAGPRHGSRLLRMTGTVSRVYGKAREIPADAYHIHDPELLPAAMLLRLGGKLVVYDVHEDYSTAVLEKGYIPMPLRRALSWGIRRLEPLAASPFPVVIAEKYYAERFPEGVPILNYPLREELVPGESAVPELPPFPRLLYTGNITEARGAANHVSLLKACPGFHLFMVGRCSPDLAARLRAQAGEDAPRLHIVGEGQSVPFGTILGYYAAGGWTAGLALFPPSVHYERKELTKFFEYMSFGIPVLASAFPAWKDLVEGNGCGLCVDPADRAAAAAAVAEMAGGGAAAKAMGGRGRAAVEERFNWDREEAKLLALYGSLFRK